MPVKSYIAQFSSPAALSRFEQRLPEIKGCDLMKTTQQTVAILITDTSSEAEDERLFAKIRSIEGCSHIALVSAFTDQS